jgi:hypothetical protein
VASINVQVFYILGAQTAGDRSNGCRVTPEPDGPSHWHDLTVPARIPQWEYIPPTEANGYSLFRPELEDDPLVFFHVTPAENLDPIAQAGFGPAKAVGVGNLESVSYAKRSSGCLTHINHEAPQALVVIVVRFETLDQSGIQVNVSDIHVYDQAVQPTILGYCLLPKGFCSR